MLQDDKNLTYLSWTNHGRNGLLTRRHALSTLGAAALAPIRPGPARPSQADAFVDSVGVNVHLGSPPYDRQFDSIAALAGSLGVRHFRDELRPDNDLARWRALHAWTGVRSHLLVSPATNTVPELLGYLGALGVERVSAVEGQNEGDSDWFRSQPAARPGWAGVVTAYQRDVFTALRARYRRAVLPVLSPTVLDYKPADMRQIASAASFCDMVALHAYPQGGQKPETEDAYAGLGWYLRAFRDPFKRGAPVMVTETGYAGLSAAAAAKYLPRLLLHAWSAGIARSFLYEFMDGGADEADPEQNYGLVSSTAEPKPAFHALRLLLGALADPGPGFVPTPLAFEFRGGPADLRMVPFAKRTGEVVLALWRAAPSWDPVAKRDNAVASSPAQVTLSRPFRAAATLSLQAGRAWTPMAQPGGALEIEASDTVTLLRLTP